MDDVNERFEKSVEVQIRFLELLRILTDAGRAEWFQAEHDPGFVHCLLDKEDLIKFHCSGGKKGNEPVPPSEPLTGIVANYCNTTYLWLPDQANGWELLLRLLRSARVDDERFVGCRRIAHWAPIRALEERLRK